CNYGPATDYTPEELHNLWAHYAAEAELVDRHLGRVLQKIDDLQLWDDSIVVVTSDHGMSLGEHNRTGKSNICDHDPRYWPIYPEIGHVPFLLAGAGVPQGKSLDLLGSPVDLLPTACELAGAGVEPPQALQGRSFAAQVRSGQGIHRDHVVSGCCIQAPADGRPRKAVTPFVTTRSWGYAPVGAHGTQELYELMSDPLAETDVSDGNESVLADMHALLVEHLREHGASDATVGLWESAADEATKGSWAIDYPEPTI
ncbi:sulfatase-like hydrolase/transferase, partial [bacterium]|nr:sulfatase-like hydrolase/transferase [bacterium]